jgi:hypothetical protein
VIARAVVLLAVLLAGCALQPASPIPPPEVAPQVQVVACVVPAGMTAPSAPPAKPEGAYTQRDVAEYLDGLYAWGARAWTRIAAIRTWSDECDRRAGSRTGR